MKSNCRIQTFLFLAVQLVSVVRSQIFLHVDATNEEVYFSGSASGKAGAGGAIEWAYGSMTGGTTKVSFSTTDITTTPAVQSADLEFASAGFAVTVGFGTANANITFQGTGDRVSYGEAPYQIKLLIKQLEGQLDVSDISAKSAPLILLLVDGEGLGDLELKKAEIVDETDAPTETNEPSESGEDGDDDKDDRQCGNLFNRSCKP